MKLLLLALLLTGCTHNIVNTELRTGQYDVGECFIGQIPNGYDEPIVYKVIEANSKVYIATRTAPYLNGVRKVIIQKKDMINKTTQVECVD